MEFYELFKNNQDLSCEKKKLKIQLCKLEEKVKSITYKIQKIDFEGEERIKLARVK